MKIDFYKYQGTGNDFIMIDNRDGKFYATQQHIELLCHRRFGIGADGLILLENAPEFDFKMVYYNSDGKLSSMCGNGGRCIAAFAKQLGIGKTKNCLDFLAVDGHHKAQIMEAIPHGFLVDLEMQPVQEIERVDEHTIILNTGSPHFVRISQDVDKLDLVAEARKIRYNERFMAQGINVNYIQKSGNSLKVRTYERGVEDETYSCGTGVVASYIAADVLLNAFQPDKILTKGGALQVKVNKIAPGNYLNIHLIGPAQKVFEGQIELL
ncbi:MAG: diaminopimelate epimerase [Flavobacteriales bacterium]|nr:diaminopimelate epimerase [Flavobacteriales bacterium]